MSGNERIYTAPTLEGALARVKLELGQDAVIVSTRRVGGPPHEAEIEVRAAPAATSAAPDAPAGTGLVHRLLARNGLDDVMARLLDASAPVAKSLGEVRAAVARAVGVHVRFARPTDPSTRRVVAFVGPTGVGKTTTLAKIAAELALVGSRRVGIVTTDNYRVGAAAQIEQLADLIGVPLLVARDAPSFARALERLGNADAVLVDTAGRSPRDHAALAELATWLHAPGVEPVSTCLCLAATSRSPELDELIRRHAVLRPTHLIATKLDEAVTHDGILSACIASGLPLAWLTTGQRVPEDLTPASGDTLAAALCGEETYR